MPHTTLSLTEIRRMERQDLEREIMAKRALVTKLHLSIVMQNEKDTAKYQRENKELARLLTVWREKEGKKQQRGLNAEPKPSRVPALA